MAGLYRLAFATVHLPYGREDQKFARRRMIDGRHASKNVGRRSLPVPSAARTSMSVTSTPTLASATRASPRVSRHSAMAHKRLDTEPLPAQKLACSSNASFLPRNGADT